MEEREEEGGIEGEKNNFGTFEQVRLVERGRKKRGGNDSKEERTRNGLAGTEARERKEGKRGVYIDRRMY